MGILSRFGDIMKSNINALLDRAEDPEKMIDQFLRDASENLAEVRRETALVKAEERRAKAKVDDITKSITEYTELAKKALQAGSREDAAVFISKKQQLEADLPEFQNIYEQAKTNADHMVQMHNKLVNDIEAMKTRKGITKGKAAAAKARESVNKMGSNSTRYGAAVGRIAEMEERIDQRYNTAMAASELLEAPTDTAADLAAKYRNGASATVDAELAALEAELGITP